MMMYYDHDMFMLDLCDLYPLRLLRYYIHTHTHTHTHVCLDFGICVRLSVYFLNICYIRVFYRFNRNRALQKPLEIPT
jgi:hypothetical protein